MAASEVEQIDFKISPDDQDEHGFVSVWNIASATVTVIWKPRGHWRQS